jgi:hypothetical protein
MNNQGKINPYQYSTESYKTPTIFGHDSLWGYQQQPQRECVYPHSQLLYMLDHHIFQQSVMKKNMNPQPGYKPHSEKKDKSPGFNPNQSFISPSNQRSLGKYDLQTGGFNNQRELRGIMKDEKSTQSRNVNISMFSYGRF